MRAERRLASLALGSEVLTWLGLAGSAASLFTRLGPLIEMSATAAWLADTWATTAHAVADAVSLWVGIASSLSREMAVVLSFAISAVTAILGVSLKARAASGIDAEPSLILRRAWLLPLLLLAAAVLAIASLWAASRMVTLLAPLHGVLGTKGTLVLALLAIAFVAAAPFALLCAERGPALLFVAVFAPMPLMLAQVPLLVTKDMSRPVVSDEAALASWVAMALAAALVPLALALAPARLLNARFVFVLAGVAILIGLNYAGRLGGI